MALKPIFPFYIEQRPLVPLAPARPRAALMDATILRSGAGRASSILSISGGDNYGDGDNGTEKGHGEKSKLAGSQVSAGTNAKHRDRGAYRRR